MTRDAFVAAMTLLGVAGVACAGPRPTERPSSSVGQPLTLALPDLQGRTVDVGARAGAVRVVDFWATWCAPCREALPAIDALARDLGPRGVEVYAVSIDEGRGVIDDYLRQSPLGIPVLWDHGGAALGRIDATIMPVTVLVDRRGVIRKVHQGWAPDRAQVEREEVEALLGER